MSTLPFGSIRKAAISMRNTRLLFAAARGARIQRKHYVSAYWDNTRVIPPIGTDHDRDYYYRIHPKDEHLQYGPVSSALRQTSELGYSDPIRNSGLCVHWQLAYIDHILVSDKAGVTLADGTTMCNADLHRSLYYAILAEVAADEGL